ncbi:erythronate-4-phosphate dehydrogenase [Legionella wadsworthii]|uniref:Erythronate-4-phosphate dehydrogenase n=1 Tax=Legionella wadsworthii TaxID=28088 RepID=A0A378LXC0_9GAMM|nr:NAD(P)-dependent oxidoreductase [Legionella wadsworthii]STY28721.1 erythronate-4-phosphate dehydrogenase [Legionella wadsworthii]
MNILADASLPGLEKAFPLPFHLTKYNNPEEITDLLPGQDILFCRANLKVNKSLLKNHCLRYVATASSGTDHLDHRWLKSQNIQIIDAKGANARAVADYVVSCVAYLTQAQLYQGNKIGIIGLGHVGSHVAYRLHAVGFDIFKFDPLKEKKDTNHFRSCSLEELYQADLLCVHAELHDQPPYPSMNLIDKNFLNRLKPGCVLINAARGGIVNEKDLLQSPKPFIYCTDVYLNEPDIDAHIIDKAILCTPHIAGHSIEAKYTAVAMVSTMLHQLTGLSLPQFFKPKINQVIHFEHDEAWIESVLKIYNPLDETLCLKQATQKKNAFLELRKNHRNRHDFLQYATHSNLPDKTKFMLGITN